ncbi:MAG: hypothetical protein WC136_07115, partial [Sphaerochaeta sp.]
RWMLSPASIAIMHRTFSSRGTLERSLFTCGGGLSDNLYPALNSSFFLTQEQHASSLRTHKALVAFATDPLFSNMSRNLIFSSSVYRLVPNGDSFCLQKRPIHKCVN